MFMMVGCVQEELNAMKQGLNDVIPNDLLSGLTAEVRPLTSYTQHKPTRVVVGVAWGVV